MPLEMHPLVCYCINTVLFTGTQCFILFQKTEEFNNGIDMACQKCCEVLWIFYTPKCGRKHALLQFLRNNFPNDTTLCNLCFFLLFSICGLPSIWGETHKQKAKWFTMKGRSKNDSMLNALTEWKYISVLIPFMWRWLMVTDVSR